MPLAPAEMLLLTFPGERVGPATVDAIRHAVADGLRVIDLFFVSRRMDGQVRVVELTADGPDGLRVAGVGQAGSADANLIASAVRPGTSAAVIVFQRRRGRRLPACLTAVGEVALHGTVPPELAWAGRWSGATVPAGSGYPVGSAHPAGSGYPAGGSGPVPAGAGPGGVSGRR